MSSSPKGDAPTPSADAALLVLPCADLDAAMAFYVDSLGFRLDMIMPADAPRVALVSGYGIKLRLQVSAAPGAIGAPVALHLPLALRPSWLSGDAPVAPDGMRVLWVAADAPMSVPAGTQELVISRADASDAWVRGRAGMLYRDLIPGRLGGRFIASQIRIPEGGPVPDYVHFHQVRLQLIYCRRGWVRVVYEDQGEPFVMHAGDCVLQPPTIRHRVLEASPGLEVIEIGCPAEHETRRDHELALPSPEARPGRRYGGQAFVHHVAAQAPWQRGSDEHIEQRMLGIAAATNGLAEAHVIRLRPDASGASALCGCHDGELLWCFVLDGQLALSGRTLGEHVLGCDDAIAIPAGSDYRISARSPSEVLMVVLPGTPPDSESSGTRPCI